MDDYVPPAVILLNGIDLQNEFDVVLNNLVLAFPKGKITPDVSSNIVSTQTYADDYIFAQKAMFKLQEDYFLYKNSILKNSEEVLIKIKKLDDQIDALDNENKVLKDKLFSLKSSSYSAAGMLDDSKLSRNQLLLGNIFLFIIVSSVGYIYYKKTTGNS